MAFTDYKLKYLIEADSRSAQQALAAMDRDINRLGAGFSSAFSSAVPIVGTLATAISGAGLALFNLTKNAADFGSEIFDASQKTGLGAEAISSLKAAAETSGSSLESVTAGIAKFVKQYKGTGSDIQLELGKVMKEIAGAKSGFEQITLAQKNFGKAGADLIPVIQSFKGNLPDLIRRMTELGIAIDDKAAYEADEFGDTLDILQMQLAGVGRTIAKELMPEFTRMASEMSDFIRDNKDQIRDWGTFTTNVLVGLTTYWGDLTAAINKFNAESRSLGQSPFASGEAPEWMKFLMSPSMFALSKLASRGAQERLANERPGPYSWEMNKGGGPKGTTDKDGAGKRPPKETDDQFRKFFTDLGFQIERTYGRAINKGSPHTFGGAADVRIGGKTASDIFTLFVKALEKGYRVVDERRKLPGVKQTGPHLHFENAKTTLQKASVFQNLGFSPDQVAYLQNLDKERLGKATGMGGLEQFSAKRAEESAAAFERSAQRKYDVAKSTAEALIQFEEMYFDKAIDLADSDAAYAAAQRIRDQRIAAAEAEVAEAGRVAEAQVAGSEKAEEAYTQYALARVAADIKMAQADEELERRRKTIDEAAGERLDKMLDRLREEMRLRDELYEIELKQRLGPKGMPVVWDILGEEHDKAMSGSNKSQFDKLREMFSTDSIHDQAAVAGIEAMQTAFEGLAQAIGSAVQAWILYGSAGMSARQVAAQIIAGIAQQATVKAVFELAEGFAALARGFFGNPAAFAEAKAHFTSAAIYGSIAGVAALAGRGVAGNSFQQGSGGGGGGGGYSGGSSYQQAPPSPITRASDNAYYSGTHGTHSRMVADAINRLEQKISSMRPGDVLTAGTKERPGHVIQTAANEARSKPQHAQSLLKASGIR